MKTIEKAEGWAVADAIAHGVSGDIPLPSRYRGLGFDELLLRDVSAGIAAIQAMGWLTQPRFAKWLSSTLRADERHQRLLKALALFGDWPNRWWDSLDTLLSQHAQGGSNANIARVLERHREMLSKKSHPARFMQEAFVDWLEIRHPAICKSRPFAVAMKGWKRAPSLLTSAEAAKSLGKGTAAVRDMIRNGQLEGVADVSSKSKRILVTQESANEVLLRHSHALGWPIAKQILNVDGHIIFEPTFRKLMEIERSPLNRGLMIRSTRIEWLFDRIEAAQAGYVYEADAVGMRAAVVITGPIGGSYAAILSWIVGGDLPVRTFDRQHGIRSIRFNRSVLKDLVRRKPGAGQL